MVRVNYIQLEDDDVRAQEDYDNLFYELDSDAEEESTQRDFCKPLQCSDFPNQPSNHNIYREFQSARFYERCHTSKLFSQFLEQN